MAPESRLLRTGNGPAPLPADAALARVAARRLARCQQARATGAAPGGGISCAATDDTDELRDATNKAAQSFDAFFDSVGASEIELAMDAVRRRDRVREIVPLRDG